MILVMHPFGSSGVQNTSGMSFVLLFLLLLIGLSDPWTGLTSLSHELGSRLLKLDPLLSLGPLYGMPFPSLCMRLPFWIIVFISLSLLKTCFFSRGSHTGSATEWPRL